MTTYYLVPNTGSTATSDPIKESNSTFVCPANMVMIGRKHSGDENGSTTYKSAPLMVDPNTGLSAAIQIANPSGWIDAGKQSSLDYQAPAGWVITGRKHDGDENGHTFFQISQVLIGNALSRTVDQVTSGSIKESSGTWYDTPALDTMKGVITGMSHSGDENGSSKYTASLVFFPGS